MREIEFENPIKIGGKDVKKITLREPTAGELRGLKLTDVLQGDAGALITLIPRIATPAMTEAEVAGLKPGQFGRLFSGVVGFFSGEADATSTS